MWNRTKSVTASQWYICHFQFLCLLVLASWTARSCWSLSRISMASIDVSVLMFDGNGTLGSESPLYHMLHLNDRWNWFVPYARGWHITPQQNAIRDHPVSQRSTDSSSLSDFYGTSSMKFWERLLRSWVYFIGRYVCSTIGFGWYLHDNPGKADWVRSSSYWQPQRARWYVWWYHRWLVAD